METTNPDNYVLVLEDRSQTKNAGEAGKLSVVSSLDKDGKIKTAEPLDANSTAFMKFKKNDGLLQNFFSNLARQFKDPSHIGVYRLVADKVEESVGVLKKMLENRDTPANKAAIDAVKITAEARCSKTAPLFNDTFSDYFFSLLITSSIGSKNLLQYTIAAS